jgi:hypothetical protein
VLPQISDIGLVRALGYARLRPITPRLAPLLRDGGAA